MGCQNSIDSTSPSKLKYQFSPQLMLQRTNDNPQSSHLVQKPAQLLELSILHYQEFIENHNLLEYPFEGLGCVQDQVGYFQGRVEEWYRAGREKGTLLGNPYDALSLCFSLKEETEQAEQWYLKMLEREPKAYQLNFGLGNIYYKRHDFGKAEEQYKRALDLNPRLDKAYQNIAAIYCYHLHDNGKASEWASFALKVNKKNEYAALMRELVKEDVDSKMEGLLKINLKFPTFVRVHNALGLCWLEKNETREAIAWFKKGLEVNPLCYVLMCSLALAQNMEGNSETAIRLSQEMMLVNPKHHQPYFSLGQAYCRKGNFDEAEGWYRKCIEINQKFKLSYLQLSKLYMKQGKQSEARLLLESLQVDSQMLSMLSCGVDKLSLHESEHCSQPNDRV